MLNDDDDEDEEIEEIDEDQEEEISKLKQKSSERTLFYKKLLSKYGMFCSLLTALFVILAAAAVFSRESWKLGLKDEITEVLSKNAFDAVTVEEWIKVNSALSVSLALYNASSADGKTSAAAIVRVPTLWGSTAAVYLCREETWEFVNFSHISSPTSLQVKQSSLSSQIHYWQNKLTKVSSALVTSKTPIETELKH